MTKFLWVGNLPPGPNEEALLGPRQCSLIAGKLKSKPVKLSSHQANHLPVCVLRKVEEEPSHVWRKLHDTVHLRLSPPAATKYSCATFPELEVKVHIFQSPTLLLN